jgi:hypothetical protein
MLVRPALPRAPLRRRGRLSHGGNGFHRGRGPAFHRRIVPKSGTAAAAQHDRLPPGRANELKPTPSTTRAADAAAPSGSRYLDQVFITQRRSPLTIERRPRPLSRGWEVRRPVAGRLARLTARTLVSAGLLTPAGRACSNQIGDAFPWRALQRLGTPGMRQIRSTRVDPPQSPVPCGGRPFFSKRPGSPLASRPGGISERRGGWATLCGSPSGPETRSAASGERRARERVGGIACVDHRKDRRGVISRREYGVRSGGRRDSRLGDATSAASRVRGRRHRARRDPRGGRRFRCGDRLDHQPRWGTRVSRCFRFDARAARLAAQRRP